MSRCAVHQITTSHHREFFKAVAVGRQVPFVPKLAVGLRGLSGFRTPWPVCTGRLPLDRTRSLDGHPGCALAGHPRRARPVRRQRRGSDFVLDLLDRAGEAGSLRAPEPTDPDRCLARIMSSVAVELGLSEAELTTGCRRRQLVEARYLVSYLAVCKNGFSLGAVARKLRISKQSVLRGIERKKAMASAANQLQKRFRRPPTRSMHAKRGSSGQCFESYGTNGTTSLIVSGLTRLPPTASGPGWIL